MNKQEIIELYHTARIAGHSSRYDRMFYVKQQLCAKYPSKTPKQIWFAIEYAIA